VKRLVLPVIALVAASVSLHAQTKVACIGNSITINSGYPAKLGTLLGSGYAVTNLGTSGVTVNSWARHAELFALQPSIITIKLGTNNAKSGDWMIGTQAAFYSDYNRLIDTIYKNVTPRPQIYLCLPTPAAAACSDAGSICGIIVENEILHVVKRVAEHWNLPIIDTHTPLLTHMDYFGDGVHPDSRGADSLAAIIYRALSGANLVPDAVIESPAYNQTVAPGSDITITATATDNDGTIARVVFSDGTTSLGQVTTPPFNFTIHAIGAGEHKLYARAIDNRGAESTDMVHIYAISYPDQCDSIQRKYWLNVGGGAAVSTIPLATTPSGVTYIKDVFKGLISGGSTASYISGYICAPTTGDYTFWLCSTDDGELWLSTDNTAANKQRVSYITGNYAGENDFRRAPTAQSALVPLQAGHKYYYEILSKGGCCGNWVQLTWRLPNNSFENPMPVSRFSSTSTQGGQTSVSGGQQGATPRSAVCASRAGFADQRAMLFDAQGRLASPAGARTSGVWFVQTPVGVLRTLHTR
jgi:lysophospholipase L1-like esterase